MKAKFILQSRKGFWRCLEEDVLAEEDFEDILNNKNKKVYLEDSEVKIEDRKYSLENIEVITLNSIYYPKKGEVYLGDFREDMVEEIKCYLKKK